MKIERTLNHITSGVEELRTISPQKISPNGLYLNYLIFF